MSKLVTGKFRRNSLWMELMDSSTMKESKGMIPSITMDICSPREIPHRMQLIKKFQMMEVLIRLFMMQENMLLKMDICC